jgi:nucleotidyltransferase/DNA polymerase involved in DNA repair
VSPEKPPCDSRTFLPPLPVGRISGVGKVTEHKLETLGIRTVGDLRTVDGAALQIELAAMNYVYTNLREESTIPK